MEKRDEFFYIFTYVDGSEQEFKRDNDELSSIVMNPGRERIQVENTIINLDNVVKITVETKTQRDEEKRITEEKTRESIELLRNIKF